MSRYLTKSTEVWRVDTESEAKALIEEAKKEPTSTLSKYISEYKERKIKGEIADSWYRVTLTKIFQDEKEPDSKVDVKYTREHDFPSPINKEVDVEDNMSFDFEGEE